MSQNQRRLKIALVTDTVNTAAGAGAVVSGQLLADRLRQHNDVIVISSDSQNADVKLRGIRPTIFASVRHGQFVFAIPDRKKIREAFADVDIVHLHLPFWLSFVALDEARKAGKIVVASFHVQPENILSNVHIHSPWLSRKLYRFWIKNFWNRADLVMCPSPFAVQKLQSYDLRTPAVAISNGVTTEPVSGNYEREPQHKGYFLIFMLGRLDSEKEQHILINAVKRSKHRDKIKIVIAGMGKNEKKLRRLGETLPNGAEVGFISDERKTRLLATADLFVHCSSVELEGMAVLEAMGAGLPALVAEGPETAAADLALPDFRFPVGNADVLMKKIDWLIDHPEDLERARKLYRDKAQKLSVVKSVKDIETEYQALCR